MTYNVVVVVVDALRADKVGAVGEQELTPNVDEFAEDAVTFTNAFTTINATDPAVTSLQTGRYPLSNGVINHGIEVTDAEKQSIEQITQLPECLSEAGYRTAKFGRPLGRWHRRGFDIYPSSMETSEAFDVRNESQNLKGRIASGLNSIHPKLQESASRLYNTATEATKNQLPNEEATNKADEDGVVDNISEFVSGDSPFYAFVHLMNTHGPYVADPDRVVSLLNRFDYPVDRGYNPMTDTNHVGDIISSDFQEAILAGEYPEIREKYYFDSGEPSTAIVDAHYDAAVTKADERFGQIIEELRQSSVYEETIVAFLADHGESLTENGIYYNHHGLYDVSTHIPLIIRPPPSGTSRKIDDLVQITDIAPTICSYTGVKGIESDGISLKPAIEDRESIDRAFVLAEEAHHQRRRMIRTPDYKFIHLVDGDTICRRCSIQHAPPIELYDLSVGEVEENNIANKEPKRVDELRERADEAVTELAVRCPRTTSETNIQYDDEEEVRNRLRDLGYV